MIVAVYVPAVRLEGSQETVMTAFPVPDSGAQVSHSALFDIDQSSVPPLVFEMRKF